MEQDNKEVNLIDVCKAVWAKRKKVLRYTLVGGVAGVVIAFSIPKEYETKIIIAPEGSGNSSTNMSGLGALAGFAGIDLNSKGSVGITETLYPQIVKSSPFLLEFASIRVPCKGSQTTLEHYLFDEQKRSWWSYILGAPGAAIGWISSIGSDINDTVAVANSEAMRQAFVDIMGTQLEVKAGKTKGTYEVSAKMQDPEISLLVADSLLVKLQRYMIDYRTSKARQALTKSQELFAQAKENYYVQDMLYAQALDRNQNLISRSAQVQLDRLKNEMTIAYQIYQQLASQVEVDKIKLQEETPIATVIEPAKIPLRPAAPNKKMIIIAFAFLGLFVATGIVAVREIFMRK